MYHNKVNQHTQWLWYSFIRWSYSFGEVFATGTLQNWDLDEDFEIISLSMLWHFSDRNKRPVIFFVVGWWQKGLWLIYRSEMPHWEPLSTIFMSCLISQPLTLICICQKITLVLGILHKYCLFCRICFVKRWKTC